MEWEVSSLFKFLSDERVQTLEENTGSTTLERNWMCTGHRTGTDAPAPATGENLVFPRPPSRPPAIARSCYGNGPRRPKPCGGCLNDNHYATDFPAEKIQYNTTAHFQNVTRVIPDKPFGNIHDSAWETWLETFMKLSGELVWKHS